MENEIKEEDIENKNPIKELEELEKANGIPEQLKSILTDTEIPENKKITIISLFVGSIRGSFKGPIPPPKILKDYNEAVKDGAERVVAMAEKQLHHRIQLEDYTIKESLKQSKAGQIFGFILGFAGLLSASILALLGHETTAGIFGTTTIVGLVAVFVWGGKSSQKDSPDKN